MRTTDEKAELKPDAHVPIKPVQRPKTKRPLIVPISIYSCASSLRRNGRQTNNPSAKRPQTEKTTCIPSEAARIAEQVDKSHANNTVHVQNQIRFFAGGDLLHLQGVVQHRRGGKVLTQELLRRTIETRFDEW